MTYTSDHTPSESVRSPRATHSDTANTVPDHSSDPRSELGAAGHRIALTIRLLLLAAVSIAPWWYGAAQPIAGFCLATVVTLAVGLWLLQLLLDSHPATHRVPIPIVAVVLAAGLLLGLAQLWPLPASVLESASPFTADLYRSMDSHKASATAPISLHPAATRLQSAWLAVAALLVLLGARFLADRRSLAWLGVSLAVNSAAVSALGISQQLLGDTRLFFLVEPAEMTTGFGSYVNHNNAAGFLLMGLAAGIGCWLSRPHPPRPTWALGLITLSAAGILASLSRSGFLAAGCGFLVLALCSLASRVSTRQWVGLAASLAVAVGVIAWAGQSSLVTSRLASLLDQSTQPDQRLAHWNDSLNAAPRFLIAGSGLGSYRHAYLPFETTATDEWFYFAENQYLQALFEAGLPGLILLLLALGLSLSAAYRLLVSAADPFDRGFAAACLFGLSAQAVHSSFDFGLYLPANMALLALATGALFGRLLVLSPTRPFRVAVGWSGPARPATAIAVVIVLLAESLFPTFETHAVAKVTSARHQLRTALADPDLQPDAHEAAAYNFSRAIESRWDDPEAHRSAAEAFIELYRRRTSKLLAAERPELKASHHAETRHRLADPAVLGRFVSRRVAAGDARALDTYRDDPIVQQTLVPAIRHLWLARRHGPLLAGVHLRLAELAFLAVDPAEGPNPFLVPLERLAGHRTNLWFRIGQIAFDARDDSTAVRAWQRALVSHHHTPRQLIAQVLDSAESRWPGSQIVEHLLPPRPALLMDLAAGRYSGEHYQQMRSAVLLRTRQLLLAHSGSMAEACYLQGRFEALHDRPRIALISFQKSLAMTPVDPRVRFELARTLDKLGRRREAFEQARLCAQLDPAHPGARRLLKVLRDRLSSLPLEARP